METGIKHIGQPSYTALPAKHIDFATVAGLLGCILLIFLVISLNTSAVSFIDLRSSLIVVGGTFLATLTSFSFPKMINAIKIVFSLVFRKEWGVKKFCSYIIYLSDVAKKRGTLTLESHFEDTRHNSFLLESLMLLVDGTSEKEIKSIMEPKLDSIIRAEMQTVTILKKAASIAPAMGLIGTLVGLIQMLGNLQDPSKIGPDMALALLTTLYGALLANVVLMPLATKLASNIEQEKLLHRISLTGIYAMARQENPRKVEILLKSIIPNDKK